MLASTIASFDALPAAAAVSQALFTKSGAYAVPNLSYQLASVAFPAGAPTVVIVSNHSQWVSEAAPIAAALGVPLLVSPTPSDPGAVNTWLDALGASSAHLYGNLDSRFKLGLSATVLSSTKFVDRTTIEPAFKRSTATFSYLPVEPIVVASTQVANSVPVASALAVLHGANLVVLDGTESDADIQNFFASRGDKLITVVGEPTTLEMNLLPPLEEALYAIVDPTSWIDAFFAIGLDVMRSGSSGADLWSAPSSQTASMAIASVTAKATGKAFVPAGPLSAIGTDSAAHQYATAWGPEMRSVALVGVDVATTHLNSVVNATTTSRLATPTFSVADVSLGASSYTITVSPQPGATRYEAYTVGDQVAGMSTTPVITVQGLPGTVMYIAAYDGAGSQIASFPMRINDFQEAADRTSALVGTIKDGGKHHLNWLDDSDVPRLIMKHAIDPMDDNPEEPTGNFSSATVVAITCANEFTTPAQDLTKQWVYQVETLSTSGVSCGAGPSNLNEATGSGLNLPFMAWPALAARSMDSADTPMPGYTVADLAIQKMIDANGAAARSSSGPELVVTSGEQEVEDTAAGTYSGDKAAAKQELESGGVAAFGPGDDMEPMRVFYIQYIPDQYVPFPAIPTYDPWRPLTAFGGDNRHWADVFGSARAWNMSSIYFGTDHEIYNYRDIGTTHQYKCTVILTDCVETQTATEDINTIGVLPGSGPTRAVIGQWVSATIPLADYAPAIDGTALWDLKRGGSSVRVEHDMMPRHQLWYGNTAAQAYLAWQNEYYSPFCLYGYPGCVKTINVQF